MDRTVGIAGGGYVGSQIIEQLLLAGFQVRCMDNFHKGNCDHLFAFARSPNFEFMQGDVNHLEDVEKFTDGLNWLFNTASIVGFPACLKHQVLARHTHISGVINLLSKKSKDCKFIQFSTDSCYGKNDEFCTEETPLNPQSLYGITKQEAEKIALSFDNTLILRFSTGMGVSHVMRCNLLVNDFTYEAVTTGKLSVFEPNASRSFINVYDMASAAIHFMKLLDTDKNKHRIYNVGDDDLNYTKGQLADLISIKTGCKVELMEGSDPDCRDYKISHDRQYEAGFKPKITMSETIDSLIRAVPLIEWQKKYQ